MKKQVVTLGIIILLLAVGLSGCVKTNRNGDESTETSDENGSTTPSDEDQDKEKFTTLPDGTKVYGDIDKLKILNYSVVTEKAINYTSWIYATTYEKIADGLVYSKDASRYRVNATVKNIAGEPLDTIRIDVKYYDNIDNLLHSDYEYGYDLYTGDIIDFSFIWTNYSSPSYFEHADHISFEILAL